MRRGLLGTILGFFWAVAILALWAVAALAQAPAGPPLPGALPTVPGSPAPGAQRPGMPPPRDGGGAAAPQTGTATLRGRVLAAGSTTALRRAQIALSSADPRSPVRRVTTTDGEGRFEFREVPAGRFSVTATKAGYVTLQFGQRRPYEAGTPVTIADGQTVERVDFALPRGSVIVVRLTDEFGEPVAGAQVQIQRFQYGPDGQRRLTSVSTGGLLGLAGTDDRGEMRAFGLMPGEYVVMGGVRNFVAPAVAGANPNDASEGFANTYYPGTASSAEATPVTVGVGQEVSVQFSMVPSRMGRVMGTVVDAEGRPLAGAQLSVVTSTGGGYSSYGAGQTAADGSFNISGIAPGEHTIRVTTPQRAGRPAEFASVPVVVGAADIAGLTITTGLGATVSGRVLFEGTSSRATTGPLPMRVSAQQANPQPNFVLLGGTTDPMANGTIDDEGDFTLAGVSGRVFFTVPAPPGWVLKSVTLDGEDITDTPIEMAGRTAISDLRLVLTDKLTSVTGQVTDDRGQAMTDYVVVIQPADRKEPLVASRSIRVVRPDTSGRFETRGIRPGRYVATAIEALEQGRQFSPEFQQELRRGAREFSLREGEAVTVDLKMTGGL